MVYRAIGIMSGSSLDGLDIVFVEFHEQGGKWNYEIKASACYPYSGEWVEKLRSAIGLSAKDYMQLHSDYGHYIGQEVRRFMSDQQLQFKVGLVSSHGHTTFHVPSRKMTAQLGDGAAIASELQLPVITDLRAMDVAFGGQGAPIVPIGEKYLLGNYDYYLNLGGIANISSNTPNRYIAYDICAANRVLNMLVNTVGKEYDDKGSISASGIMDEQLLKKLNQLDYYQQPFPKSLANDFGTDLVYPLIRDTGIAVPDGLRTYVEHIAVQVYNSVASLQSIENNPGKKISRMLVTGGGALNDFLVKRIREMLASLDTEVVVPEAELVNFKEAMIMAFIGVLRWRQEYNVLSSVTGASRDSIGGALWLGEEA
jgi:anhydro-N-acetylmuramic acid kinase